MSTSDILTFLASVNYACIVVSLSSGKCKYGPGQEHWERVLREMTIEQQEAVSERIAHWRVTQGVQSA